MHERPPACDNGPSARHVPHNTHQTRTYATLTTSGRENAMMLYKGLADSTNLLGAGSPEGQASRRSAFSTACLPPSSREGGGGGGGTGDGSGGSFLPSFLLKHPADLSLPQPHFFFLLFSRLVPINDLMSGFPGSN